MMLIDWEFARGFEAGYPALSFFFASLHRRARTVVCAHISR